MENKRIVFLVSGNGGSLKTIIQAIARFQLPWHICLVLADRDCEALRVAERHGLVGKEVPYTCQVPTALRETLQQYQPDLVVTTIHKILDAETLALFAGRFLNLHYSLLPAFKGYIGMETVVRAKHLNVGIVGATCHQVTEAVDSGPILAQCALAVDWQTETLEQVTDLVFRGAGMVLLEGIRQKLGPTRVPTFTPGQEQRWIFSPSSSFDLTKMDEAFWQAVRNG